MPRGEGRPRPERRHPMTHSTLHVSLSRVVLASLCAAIPALALAPQQQPEDLSPSPRDGRFAGATISPDSAHVVYAVEFEPDRELELRRVAIADASSTAAIGDPFLAPPGTAWR